MESNNEKTRVDGSVQEVVPAEDKSQQTQPEENKEETQKGTNDKFKQAAASAGGAMAGVGAMAFMGFVSTEKSEEIIIDPEPPVPQPAVDGFDGKSVPVATGVNDDMSFSEAFAAARAETGPGGVFFWKGGVYGTYYRNEWEQLSPEYKEAFSNYPCQQPENTNTGSGHAQEELRVSPPPPNTSSNDTPTNGRAQPESVSDNVEVLGIHYAEVDGQTVAVAPISVHGNEALLVDMDTDGIFVYALIDNGTGTPNVISEYQLTHQDANTLQQAASEEAYLVNNNLPDYTNDASVDNFTMG